MTKDCTRMSELVGRLRENGVNAHHATATVQLKAKHTEKQFNQLEDRMARERTGSAAVNNRMKELQGIQEEISDTVQAGRTGSEYRSTTRRVLTALSEQGIK